MLQMKWWDYCSCECSLWKLSYYYVLLSGSAVWTIKLVIVLIVPLSNASAIGFCPVCVCSLYTVLFVISSYTWLFSVLQDISNHFPWWKMSRTTLVFLPLMERLGPNFLHYQRSLLISHSTIADRFCSLILVWFPLANYNANILSYL